jgi:hypothetical protein
MQTTQSGCGPVGSAGSAAAGDTDTGRPSNTRPGMFSTCTFQLEALGARQLILGGCL